MLDTFLAIKGEGEGEEKTLTLTLTPDCALFSSCTLLKQCHHNTFRKEELKKKKQ
jgi:hypothetical protein